MAKTRSCGGGMERVIEYEYNLFLEEINKNDFIYGVYLDAGKYEYDCSHHEIIEGHIELGGKIFNYLKENRPNEFVLLVSCGCYIRVETKKSAMQRPFFDEDYIVEAGDEWPY